MNNTGIDWTEVTWNPVTGCTKCSPGCKNCYAEPLALRLQRMGNPRYRNEFEVTLHPDKLDEPLKMKKGRMIFVNSMSDLFHPDVPDEFISAVFGVMAACPQHTFQVLTKRAERMAKWFGWVNCSAPNAMARFDTAAMTVRGREARKNTGMSEPRPPTPELRVICDALLKLCPDAPEHHWMPWPLPNVWLGVSVEDQKHADARIPLLLQTPSALRFVSLEPLLGPVHLDCLPCNVQRLDGGLGDDYFNALNGAGQTVFPMRFEYGPPGDYPSLDWVISGGESGFKARPAELDWFRTIRDACQLAGIPLFHKQHGGRGVTHKAKRSGELAAIDGVVHQAYPAS